MSQQLNSAVRERPILFSGPMVKAVIDGRKTQTRRVVKPQPPAHVTDIIPMAGGFVAAWPNRQAIKPSDFNALCPYGQPGDRLWVRETWAAWATVGAGDLWRVRYDADGKYDDFRLPTESDWMPPKSLRVDRPTNAPSIFMPRWASRLTLEITEVRVERLQEMRGADARAEGIEPSEAPTAMERALIDVGRFQQLWDSLNAKRGGYGWDANPWCWAISFKPIDASSSSRRQRGDANG